ncbi:hypothetical protein LLG32_25990 (plasmid) [Lactococcus cremoris]|nr:hypothetical protein LLG32_25990 [Lactococcus cremoris]
MGVIDNTATGKLIFTIFSAFAQFERDMIVSRTQEGKEYSRKIIQTLKRVDPINLQKNKFN